MKNETIKRASHGKQNPYFLMTRASAQDKKMSYSAVGMLAYLLSKPQNWEANTSDLERFESKRDRTKKTIKELARAGYIFERCEVRLRGTIIGYTPIYVYEDPTDNPAVDSSNPLPFIVDPLDWIPEGATVNGVPYTQSPLTDLPLTVSPLAVKPPQDIKEVKIKEKKEKKELARDRATVSSTLMNPMKDAIADAFGWGWGRMTGNEKGMIQRTAKQLCEAQVKPSDVPALYKHVADMGVNFNPTALANHVSNWRNTQTVTRILPAEHLSVDSPNGSEVSETITESETYWIHNTPTFKEKMAMVKEGKTLKQLRAERDAMLEKPVTFEEQRQLIERDITIGELRGGS